MLFYLHKLITFQFHPALVYQYHTRWLTNIEVLATPHKNYIAYCCIARQNFQGIELSLMKRPQES